MVVEDCLRGVTSNPAIFEKAILGSSDYDEDLAAAAREGLSAREVYRRLAIKDVQLAADVLRPVYDETGGGRRLRLAGGRAAARARHRGHARAGPDVLGAGRPPERDDQDPGDRRGDPGDRAGALRGPEHQRHAAVRGLLLRARDGGVHPRHRAPSGGRPAARPPLGRLVLRLARGHGGRQAAGGARPHGRSPAGRAWPTRAPPTTRSAACSTASASPPCARRARPCSGRCGRRRASRTPPTTRRCTSTGSSGATASTRCRCPPSPPPPARARSPARRRRSIPRPTSRPCARPASTSTTSPRSCCATGSRRSWCRWPSCSTASSASARGSSPTGPTRSTPTCRPPSSRP